MRKCLTIRDHKSLLIELQELKEIIATQETDIKSNSQFLISNLPKKILFSGPKVDPVTKLPILKNPTGKILAKTINSTILRKEGFITKFIAGFIFRQIGRIVEKKYLKT